MEMSSYNWVVIISLSWLVTLSFHSRENFRWCWNWKSLRNNKMLRTIMISAIEKQGNKIPPIYQSSMHRECCKSVVKVNSVRGHPTVNLPSVDSCSVCNYPPPCVAHTPQCWWTTTVWRECKHPCVQPSVPANVVSSVVLADVSPILPPP